MSMGSFDSEPPDIDLATQAVPHVVCRYNPKATDSDADKKYKIIPRLRCSQIQYKEGHEPPTAQFFYELDTSDPTADPDVVPMGLEDYWPGAFDSEYVVKPGDRLVVLAIVGFEETSDPNPDHPFSTVEPQYRVLFDGFSKNPQFDMDGEQLHITFSSVNVAIRAWDSPVRFSLWRDSDKPDDGEAHWTSMPVRFNPDGKPNCTPDGKDFQSDEFGEQEFPLFLDWRIARDIDPRTYWTLDKAVIYLLATCNGKEEYVRNPDFAQVKKLLRNRQPSEDGGYIDPDDPSTYEEDPIKLRDTDVTEHAWPDAINRLLAYGGFGMKIVTEDDENGEPDNFLEIYRKDNDGPTDPKELNYPERGIPIDQMLPQFTNLHVAYDYHNVANEFEIETRPAKYELSIVLAPGFQPRFSDQEPGNRKDFLRSSIDADVDRLNHDIFRLFIADECGDGHVKAVPPAPTGEAVGEADDAWNEDPFDFSEIWPDDDESGSRTYSRRFRPGSTHLVTKDKAGKPLKSQLAVSRDYAGPSPGLWDGTGTWQTISGGFEILKDQLGIWVSCPDPSAWDVGKTSAAVEPSGLLDVITSFCTHGTAQRTKYFHLRLTTVIEADADIDVVAERRKASPLPFTVRRIVDAKDHFKKEIIRKKSVYNSTDKDKFGIDQTEDAKTHAAQLRAVHEFPPVAGAFIVPNITFAFEIGDRISKINGRDISLKCNAASESGEKPTYPFIVAKTWDLQKQSTALMLSDRRAEPPGVGKK